MIYDAVWALYVFTDADSDGDLSNADNWNIGGSPASDVPSPSDLAVLDGLTVTQGACWAPVTSAYDTIINGGTFRSAMVLSGISAQWNGGGCLTTFTAAAAPSEPTGPTINADPGCPCTLSDCTITVTPLATTSTTCTYSAGADIARDGHVVNDTGSSFTSLTMQGGGGSPSPVISITDGTATSVNFGNSGGGDRPTTVTWAGGSWTACNIWIGQTIAPSAVTIVGLTSTQATIPITFTACAIDATSVLSNLGNTFDGGSISGAATIGASATFASVDLSGFSGTVGASCSITAMLNVGGGTFADIAMSSLTPFANYTPVFNTASTGPITGFTSAGPGVNNILHAATPPGNYFPPPTDKVVSGYHFGVGNTGSTGTAPSGGGIIGS